MSNIPLTALEIEILNKVIPTQTLSNPGSLPLVLRNLIEDQKERLISEGIVSEADFKQVQTQAAKNIFHFLRENEFYFEREGGVFYLTDKGKQLQKQRTIQAYVDWVEKRGAIKIAELHTIAQQGYLEKDQSFAGAGKILDKKKATRQSEEVVQKKTAGKVQKVAKKNSKMVPIITIIILVVAGLVAHFVLKII